MVISQNSGEHLYQNYQQIDYLTSAELDDLPYGTIQLDAEGKVLKYNAYESQLSHLNRDDVVGKNFFTEIAPCTDVQEFHGRFLEGIKAKKLHTKFRYHFNFKTDPRNVMVTLFYSDVTDSVWVFVQSLD